MRFLALFLLIPSIIQVYGHIRLVFPAPRQPALDSNFVQNSKLPCGVPKPGVAQGHRTFLQAGTMIEIEWDSAAPHAGGIRLEVLNALDEPIALFVNFNEAFNVSETTRTVELPPKFECANCAIRLTQAMSELSPESQFVSCGDVNILNAIPDGDSCLGHGTRQNGKCKCDKNFIGDQCHREVECMTSSDCGPSAECRTSLLEPTRQCFCPQGAFGETCQLESSIDLSRPINESLYQKREDQGNEILWRIINDEIEMVLRYPGNSWVAVGWKPQDYQCFDMTSGLTSNAEGQVTKDILTNVQTSANASVVNTAVSSESSDKGDDCVVNEFWSECPEMSRECEASCDWTKYPETIPNCPRTCAPPRCVCKEGYVRKSNDDMTCVPFSFCDKEAEPHCGTNMTWAKCGTACEPSCSNMYDTAPCPATCEKPACTCADNYVRLNGKCIYWGDCPEVEHHIKEENAERTSKPKTSDITKSTVASSTKAPQGQAKKIVPKQCPINETFNECGRICEADCVTVFTRTECDGCGAADCSCIQGYARNRQGQCVYWGDCPVEGTGLETRPPTTTTTTKPSATTNPPLKVNGDVCYGDWRFPPGCKDCQYKLSWNYVEDNDTVEFSLETRVSGNSWTGVGISPQGTMVDSDMLLIKSENGKLTVEDSYSEGYGRPIKDAIQNVEQNVVGTHANGILRAQFSRPRNTKDTQDKRLDDECHYFLFPVEGGKLDNSGNITAHTTLPMVSDRKICIRSCANNKETAKETVTSPVTQKSAEKSEASSAKCENSYRYPEGCQEDKCEYEAKWDYNTKRGDVRFEIRSKNVGRWTGIGFSKTGEMANSDVYTGWVYEGKAYVTDRFSYGRQLPAIDPQDRQDAYNVSGKIENDIQILTFHRKLKTLDTTTDYPLDKCYYFLFPIGGGRVLARKSSDFAIAKTPIGYHDLYEPKSSPKKICLCDENGVVIGKDDAVPTRVRVRRQAQQAQGKLPLKDAMSCTDMTVAFVEDSRVRIRDFYSPSQASPVPDQKLGGSDSLTDAAGMQKDGVTTIVFRKKLQASDKFDHTIVNAPMSVIWAKGADSRNYVHMIPNGEDKEFTFFQPGVFRYHGKNKRGVMTINFLDDHSVPKGETVHGMQVGVSTCKGRFSMPEGCSGSECTYFVEWNSDGQVARFTVMSKLEVNRWTAVGFSHDGSMAASDVIVIGVQKDIEKSSEMQVTVTDQFMPGYGRPTIDEQQDIFDVETSFADGILNANFSRELHSDDNNDVDLKECVYLLYTPHGGRIETNGEIRKHGETPLASKTKICLDTCKEVKEETRPHSVPIPSVPIEVPPTPRIHETTIEKTRPTTVTVPKTQYTHQVQTQGTHEDTHFTQPPAIPTTQYTTQRPRIQETDKKRPSQSDPHIAVVYVPDETEQVRGKYGLRVRILNREFTDALKDSNSEYHQSLTKEVVAAINRLLHDKWKGVQVSKILGYSKGSVIADVEVVSTRDTPRPIEIKSQIEENAIRGAVNGLRIEPSTVKANLIEDEPRIEHAMVDPSFTRNIIIISVCVLLLALTILCCCCLLCRVRRTSHRFDSYPIPHPTGMHPYGNFGAPQNDKGKSFENAAFAMRHSSQTTASSKHGDSPNLNGTSSNGNGHQANGNGNHHTNGTVEKAPDGIGETTYKEWFDKVGSKPASQHVEESLVSPRGPPNTSLHPSQPYVSYPNDPSGYYTLGGEHRMGGQPPANSRENGTPRYFRQY